jgi:DNA-binding NarL/FixJ family response regulator
MEGESFYDRCLSIVMFPRDKSLPDSRTSSEEKMTCARPRVLLADDHCSWLDRVTSLLKSDFDLVGRASDGQTLVGEAKRLQPDLIVLDITMPILNGIEAAHDIHKSGPDIKLVFLTVHEEPEYVRACFAEGGLAYVKKSRLGTDLIPAIQEALLGRTFISPSVAY